jgi:hypothetical protein
MTAKFKKPKGRPRLSDSQKRVQITVTLSPEAKKLVDIIALKRKFHNQKNATISRVIADAVDLGIRALASQVLAEITSPPKKSKRLQSPPSIK